MSSGALIHGKPADHNLRCVRHGLCPAPERRARVPAFAATLAPAGPAPAARRLLQSRRRCGSRPPSRRAVRPRAEGSRPGSRSLPASDPDRRRGRVERAPCGPGSGCGESGRLSALGCPAGGDPERLRGGGGHLERPDRPPPFGGTDPAGGREAGAGGAGTSSTKPPERMGGAGLMAARPIPVPLLDAGFPHLKSRVIERTGHFYYQDKDDLLWERVRKRLRATALPDSIQYLNLLNDAISGPAEWGKLETEITIGETFFFRYAEQFAALRDTILPEIIERKSATRRLRIWSAGCSTGAEPYSLAILVNGILGESLGTWRVSIVGTDINDGFLNLAKQARFGKWALRSMPAEERERYFLGAGKDQWQVRPEFRSLVRFEKHNLLSLLDGTSPLELTDFDLILCRNVLIYFHPDTVTRIVGALHARLAEEGWMLLGHAEPNPAFSAMMQTLNLPGTVAYRSGSGVETPAIPAFEPPKLPRRDLAPLPPAPKPAE